MTKRPIAFGLVIVGLVCLGFAAIDLIEIVIRPLTPMVAWMYP